MTGAATPPRKFPPCPDSPNCVSSRAARDDARHHVAALEYRGDAQQAWQAVRDVLAAWPRTVLVEAGPGSLRAECTSRLLRFTDDLELQLDASASVIHVRSASRIGYHDLGANRARVERLRAQFAARLALGTGASGR